MGRVMDLVGTKEWGANTFASKLVLAFASVSHAFSVTSKEQHLQTSRCGELFQGRQYAFGMARPSHCQLGQ